MANKKISELQSRTPSLSDLMLVGDPSSGYSYKCTITALATLIETDIADGYVTIGTTQTISGAKTFSNVLTLTSVANATTDPDKFLVLNGSNVVNYRTGSEVLSDIGGQGALTLTTTGTSGAATLVGNTLNIPQYQTALTNPVTGTGTTNYLAKFTSTSAIGNSLVFDDGTNVGISTTSPSYKLDVNGSARVNNTLHLAGTNVTNSIAANAGMILNSDGATSSDRNFQFQIAGSEKMRLDNSGNLGLGVSPSAWSGGISSAFEGRNGSGIAFGFSTLPVVYHTSNAYYDGTNWIYKNNNKATLFVNDGYNGGFTWNIAPSGTAGNAISFTQAMTLDASGNLIVGGTSALLNATGRGNITINGSTDAILTFGNAGSYSGYVYSGSTKLELDAAASRYMQFNTNGSERMRITSGGNVGIGSTTPTAISNYVALTINGTSGSFTEYQQGGSYAFRVGSDNSEGGFISQTTNNPIRIFTNSNERMRITAGGLVGIGTTTPSIYSVLSVNKNGTGEYSGVNITNANSTANLFVGVGGSAVGNASLQNNAYVLNAAASALILGTSDTERMRIKSGGVINLSNVPSSATGLATGDIYRDGDGYLLIVL